MSDWRTAFIIVDDKGHHFFKELKSEAGAPIPQLVIAGLDPAMHPLRRILMKVDGYAGQARV
jgi:hypothetical protein